MVYICKIYNIISYLNYSLKYLCAYIYNPGHFMYMYINIQFAIQVTF